MSATLFMHQGAARPEPTVAPKLKIGLIPLDPTTYRQLQQYAGRLLQNNSQKSAISAQELVHEAWIRLSGYECTGVDHARILLARTMRRILIDLWRQAKTQRLGAAFRHVSLDENHHQSHSKPTHPIDLERALQTTQFKMSRHRQVLIRHYWYGEEIQAIATALSLSTRTVIRDLKSAKKALGVHTCRTHQPSSARGR